jgi:hypothetical protein
VNCSSSWAAKSYRVVAAEAPNQIGEVVVAQLTEHRLPPKLLPRTFSTPRRRPFASHIFPNGKPDLGARGRAAVSAPSSPMARLLPRLLALPRSGA